MSWLALLHAVFVSLVGAEMWDGDFHSAIEAEFLRDDFVEFFALFTFEDLFGDVVGGFANVAGDFIGGSLVFGAGVGVVPVPAALQGCFFGEGVIFHR